MRLLDFITPSNSNRIISEMGRDVGIRAPCFAYARKERKRARSKPKTATLVKREGMSGIRALVAFERAE